MNYFRRERYSALQEGGEDAMDAADAAWTEAGARYDAALQTIRPEMPETVRELVDGFYLHDARVLSMGRRGDTFVISLQHAARLGRAGSGRTWWWRTAAPQE